VLQRFQRLAAMPDQQLRLVAFDVQSDAIRRVIGRNLRANTEGSDEAFEKTDDGFVVVSLIVNSCCSRQPRRSFRLRPA
jgi:hypothetical protein